MRRRRMALRTCVCASVSVLVVTLLILIILAKVDGLTLTSFLIFIRNYNPIKMLSGVVSGTKYSDDMTVHFTISNLLTPTVAQAKRYAHFAAAAYCNDPDLSEWTCQDCLAIGGDTILVAEINNSSENTRAYISVDHKSKEIILTYRGTINMNNVFQDMTVEMTAIPGGSGKIQVHLGAWNDMISLHGQVEDTLRSLYLKYHVVINGHSLGGMMASLALFKLKTTPEFANLKYSLYTYGQPRTGNLDFALWVNSQKIPVVRVVNGGDIFPHSTLSSAGFVHHLRELWINGDEETFCSERLLEDPNCSNSLEPDYSLFDHGDYWDSNFPPLDCLWAHPWSYVENFI